MWCGTLQFEYDDAGTLLATTDTHTLPIDSEFQFKDYCDLFHTRPSPIMFQQLVQQAIKHYLHQQKHGSWKEQYWKSIFPPYTMFSSTINMHIFDFVGEFVVNNFKATLLPHQVEALQFVMTRSNSLLAAATGLGKTAVSLALCAKRKFTRTLIVCPPILKTNWLHEIQHFIPGAKDMTSYFCTSAERRKKRFVEPLLPNDQNPVAVALESHADIDECLSKIRRLPKERACYLIVSYNLLFATVSMFRKFNIVWNGLFFDESHALKCHKSQRSQAAAELKRITNPQYTVLLSATPSAYAKHWWNLLRMMNPVVFEYYFHFKNPEHRYNASSDKFYFAERYVNPQPMHVAGGELRWNFDTSMRLKELHALTRPYVLCQTKDVLQLPPFVREYVVVGEASKRQLEQFCSKLHAITDAASCCESEMKLSFLQMVQETSKQKLPQVKQYLQSMLDTDEDRFIVWVHFKLTMQDIANYLLEQNIKFICINGDTPPKHRIELLDMFRSDNTIRLALLSIDTCSTGLNMTFVSKTVYAELTYDHVAQVQSEGRCHRIGQSADSVLAIYLVYKNSTDELIWKSMLRKANVESLVLTNNEANFEFSTHDLAHDIKDFLTQNKNIKRLPLPKSIAKRKIDSSLSDTELLLQLSTTKKQTI